ncbi:ABC transporter substrate-binding protein [Ensifer sp. ENS05]|uniref:ABC transporter substrate-binding protein n=1 Tax=Ensifer sp. ENS05 TaxID=2769277 RepID=UPI00177F4BF4|nr:ABC transporter substrate-binding protein [Ensifer sp. ENS05]MBD9596396.1 ABC transporter substrate-binding protein [Ensifer sp. ENS05]
MPLYSLPMTRRAFLGQTALGVVTASLAAGGLPMGSVRAAAGEAPTKGGILTYNLNGDPPNFDMLANTTSYVISAVGPCYNGLVRFDPTSPDTVIGDLAERWEVSEDGKVYTFHLLKSVKFHDGAPMTAADVKFTFDTVKTPPKGYVSARASSLEAVSEIRIVDDHTVEFILSHASPSILPNLALGWMAVLPKHILEKGPMKEVVIGTGPFKLQDYVRGTSLELVRNDDYHVPDRPYLDGIKVYIIPDLGSVMAYFRTGEIQVFDYMPADLAKQAQEALSATHRVEAALNSDSFAIHFNTKRSPWDDVRVRKAVSLAVDRNAVIDTVMRGNGVQAGLTLPGKWQLPELRLHAIEGYAPLQTADALDKAKTLLKEAGIEAGFQTVITARRISRVEPWALMLQSVLKNVGIEARIDFQETAVFQETMQNRKFDINAGTASVTINDPDATFGDKILCNAPFNLSQICDPEFDRLYAEQSQTIDEQKRRAIVNDLEERVLQSYGLYNVAYARRFQGQANAVRNYLLHTNPDNNKRFEEVWLANDV